MATGLWPAFLEGKMKRTVSLLFICIYLFNCYAINFEINSKSYPHWVFQQYNFCHEENTDSKNHNNIVLWTHTVQTWPFGILYDDFSFLVDKNISWKKMMIYSFSYQSENGEVFIIKNKIINNHGNMFNEIKKYWLVKEMRNEKNFIGKIVYSFDDGELITEYTEIIVW